ncbi:MULTISPECIES: gamma-glutamyltransferase [Prauserella salsuginis group]|uniref:Gamma-glutamyltransferase n=1 Tax=Prauserella salsuginis TaxID=387889 RepID=A0ABW6FYL5_9PSEU|nr:MULTISPECIES: gamma-glutamyltransferase [Prauserella salsuginis group]MCR3720115.1 gamma-glutamyltranspeptidase / glutathione hydrolase [Prauserella flava]MCR3736339.1 gamma-glutamyltranspeptidase / glutathione hydrolase [Prauserella salsuginis]
MDRATVAELGLRARFGRKEPVEGRRGIVVTSHPLAVRAGTDVLKEGGNACDAALAAAAAQLVVEPHMTAVTGGLSMLYHDAASATSSYLNGNVAAPLTRLAGFGGADLSTGRGVPVPGWWPAFRAAHARFGTGTRNRLLAPAVQLAHDGFPVHPYLFGELYAHRAELGAHPQAREAYLPGGSLVAPGDTLRQERLGRTLQRLRDEDLDYYLGDFARAFSSECVRGGGVITPDDFHAYEPGWYEPVRGSYRGVEVVASAPPDDGGAQLVDALHRLETCDVPSMGPATESADTLELLARVHNDVYYAPARTGEEPAPAGGPRHGRMPSPGTIHVTVVDERRNIASITHSHMASPWVNGLFAEGTQLSGGGSFFQRGMPEPGRRARVYLAPNLLLSAGRPVLASGSPSVSLVACLLQNLVHLVDFGLPIEEVVAMPRFGARPHEPEHGWLPGVTLEHGFPADVDTEFRRRWAASGGWLSDLGPWHSLTGNFEGVTLDAGSGLLRSCADPRRNGAAEAY